MEQRYERDAQRIEWLEAENVKLRALLDKVGMDRAGTAGTLMGAEGEVRTLKLQLDELRQVARIAVNWLHAETPLPNWPREIRDLANAIIEKPNNVATTEGRGCQLHGIEGCRECREKRKDEH